MPEAPLDYAVQLAQQAGELLLDYFHSKELHSALKNDHSVVT